MLDSQMLESVKNYIALLENPIVLKVSLDNSEQSKEMLGLLTEIANLSNLIKISEEKLNRTPSFSINRLHEDSGIVFAGIPLGHEFTSLIMALLQVGGRKPKITDDLIENIKNIKGEYNFETYISLTCHNCPDVVQALNVLSVLNKNIKHTMIDGALYQNEVSEKEIMAVPSIYLNGKLFGNGRMSLEEIIAKLDTNKEQKDKEVLNNKKIFDMLVVGGGPAGASAAIYDLLNKQGKAVIVMPLGTLFRDSAKEIRKHLLTEGVVEGLVTLPANMFLTTSIPVVLWILNKNKKVEEKNKVFMVNASKDFKKVGKFNEWQSEKAINNYLNRIEEIDYSGYVDFTTLEKNKFNLSVQRYFSEEKEKEFIDIVELEKEIIEIESNLVAKKAQMNSLISQVLALEVSDE